MPDQHPEAAPPCNEPTGVMKPGMPDFLCQRGKGHPGVHEVVLKSGARLQWQDNGDLSDQNGDDL